MPASMLIACAVLGSLLPPPAPAGIAPGVRGTTISSVVPGDAEPVATFSIVACDTTAGIWGVAVASRFLAVGSVVPWARAGVGAVATQAFANTTWGPRGLDLLERGLFPSEALEVLLRQDPDRERRQAGIVDLRGRSVSYTGKDCMAWAGGRSGPCYAAQGNILAGPGVVEAMADSFETSRGFLGDRLLAALEAGDAAGGDSRGHQAAALRLAAAGRGYNGFNDVLCDLRVDDSPVPLQELRRIYNVWRPTELITEGYKLVEEGKYDEAIARGEEAARLEPDSGEPYYHLACYYSRAGDAAKSLHYLEWAVRLDPGLKKSAGEDPDLAPLRNKAEFKRLITE